MTPRGTVALVTPARPVNVPVAGRFVVDNVGALREAALASLGIALVPAYAVAADLAIGRLLTVLDPFLPPQPPFRALWAAGRHPLARVVALVDFLARELPKKLEPSPVP